MTLGTQWVLELGHWWQVNLSPTSKASVQDSKNCPVMSSFSRTFDDTLVFSVICSSHPGPSHILLVVLSVLFLLEMQKTYSAAVSLLPGASSLHLMGHPHALWP